MTKEFYSNGKLLLSGEYAVLDGAMAWAIPTKYGQYLLVSSNKSSQIRWKSLDEKGNTWFEATYDTETLKKISSSHSETSVSLNNILLEAQKLNPYFLMDFTGYEVETKLTFPRDWGLGSSSTLINNVANWAKVNAQELLSKTFGGSGYDIACAQHDLPILFQINKGLPTAQEILRNPPYIDSIFFVYLNQKKNSRDAIEAYRKRDIDKNNLIEEITRLTKLMIVCDKFDLFEFYIIQHEQILSEALGIPTVKSKLFSDYSGAIKSLGGWGGDFILATGNESTPEYFKKKGYPTVIPFTDMIL